MSVYFVYWYLPLRPGIFAKEYLANQLFRQLLLLCGVLFACRASTDSLMIFVSRRCNLGESFQPERHRHCERQWFRPHAQRDVRRPKERWIKLERVPYRDLSNRVYGQVVQVFGCDRPYRRYLVLGSELQQGKPVFDCGKRRRRGGRSVVPVSETRRMTGPVAYRGMRILSRWAKS